MPASKRVFKRSATMSGNRPPTTMTGSPARRSAELMVTPMTDEEHEEMKANFRTYSVQRNETILATKKNKATLKLRRSDTSIALPDLQCHYLEELPEDFDVIKKGMLHKLMSGRLRLWERREVLLTADKLFYSAETSIRLAESISLLEISKITSDAEGNRKQQPSLGSDQVESPGAVQFKFAEKANTLAILTRPSESEEWGRTYYFYAENKEDSLEWTKALRKAVHDAKAKHLRESQSTFRHYLNMSKRIYESDPVQFTIVALIVTNFVSNVVDFELMSRDPATIQRFDDCDLAFTVIFTFEFICNVFCHFEEVPFRFLRNAWNVLDLLVVIVSIISSFNVAPGNSNESLKVIRICRAFRVVRVFRRLTALRLIVVALGASLVPVLNTFFVLGVATSVFAILGVGLFNERESAVGSFTHFSEAFFTMFQCISGDGWASNIARPLFRGADSTCTYRDPTNGDCVFDLTVAIFFLSYILIVVIVVVNVVLAVLLDEFLKAAHKEQYVKFMELHAKNGTGNQYVSPLDPFLKFFVDCQDSHEMKERVDEVFDAFDVYKHGHLDFRDLREGLRRIPLQPPVTITEEDWRDMTHMGELSDEHDTISSKQFFDIIRTQVCQYVQRVASKNVALNQECGDAGAEGNTTTFLLKYVITALDELRDDMVSIREDVGTSAGGGRGDEGKVGKFSDADSPETPVNHLRPGFFRTAFQPVQGGEETRCKSNKEADIEKVGEGEGDPYAFSREQLEYFVKCQKETQKFVKLFTESNLVQAFQSLALLLSDPAGSITPAFKSVRTTGRHAQMTENCILAKNWLAEKNLQDEEISCAPEMAGQDEKKLSRAEILGHEVQEMPFATGQKTTLDVTLKHSIERNVCFAEAIQVGKRFFGDFERLASTSGWDCGEDKEEQRNCGVVDLLASTSGWEMREGVKIKEVESERSASIFGEENRGGEGHGAGELAAQVLAPKDEQRKKAPDQLNMEDDDVIDTRDNSLASATVLAPLLSATTPSSDITPGALLEETSESDTARVPVTPETDKLVSVASSEGDVSQNEHLKAMNSHSLLPRLLSSIDTHRDVDEVFHIEVMTEISEQLKMQGSIAERDMSLLRKTPQQPRDVAYPVSDGPGNDLSPVLKAVENIQHSDVSKDRLSRDIGNISLVQSEDEGDREKQPEKHPDQSSWVRKDQASPLAKRPVTAAAVIGLEEEEEEEPQEEAAVSGARTVDVRIKLGMVVSAAGDDGSPKRTAFVRVICQDLANASGLTPANFHIEKLSPGSIIVDMQMRTHASGRVPDLEMIARDLAMQAEDATSTLRAGTITRFIQALELPTLQPVLHEHAMQQQKQPVYIQQSVLAADDTKFSSGDACHLGQSPKDKVLPAGLDFRRALEIRSSPSAPRLGKGNMGNKEGERKRKNTQNSTASLGETISTFILTDLAGHGSSEEDENQIVFASPAILSLPDSPVRRAEGLNCITFADGANYQLGRPNRSVMMNEHEC